MTFPANSFKCDYLGSHTHLSSYAFASERAELHHLNEQLGAIDSHVSQLKTWRRALKRRCNELQNKVLPIYTLPIEVLSRIFEQLIVTLHDPDNLLSSYRKCLSQAFVLGSVSVHFRHVALGTPELWRRIPLTISNRKTVDDASFLLQHCMALAPGINISIYDVLNEEEARSAIDILLTPDTTPKIQALEIFYSAKALSLWIKKLENTSFPILDTLGVHCRSGLTFDFRAHKTVTRLSIYGSPLHNTIIAPPSLQYLDTQDITREALTSLLYQCPDLVECVVADCHISFEEDIQFNEPLTLSHLTCLTLDCIHISPTPSSLQNLRLPSLEKLQLESCEGSEFIKDVLLCCNVSATLTSLKIDVVSQDLDNDELYQLWGLPFPNLRELEFSSDHGRVSVDAIHMLTLRADECGNTEPRFLPSLMALTFCCGFYFTRELEPHDLLDLLDKWKVAATSCLRIHFDCFARDPREWSPELREELRSIVGSRQIEVTWSCDKILLI